MENLTRVEFQYEKTIEKQIQVIEKLEQLNTSLKQANEEQEKKLKTIYEQYEISKKENEELELEKEILHQELEEKTKELSIKIEKQQQQNSEQESQLKKQIEGLKSTSLTEQEMLFYNICKADVVLSKVYFHKRKFTTQELLQMGFPQTIVSSSETEGIQTTNFTLTKQKDSTYTLTKN